jgi:hypothetical protein
MALKRGIEKATKAIIDEPKEFTEVIQDKSPRGTFCKIRDR